MFKQNYEQCKEQVARYKEDGCCTVISLANTMDWSFGKAHRHMKKFGRKNRRGMSTYGIKDALGALGKTMSTECNGMTISRFVKSHPKGSYYVLVRGHALAVVNGVVQDWTGDTAQRRKLVCHFDMS